jgi:hypothetical protein
VVAEQVPDIKKLFGPALVDWVSIFKAFARIKSGAESTPFLAEMKRPLPRRNSRSSPQQRSRLGTNSSRSPLQWSGETNKGLALSPVRELRAQAS